MTRDGTRSSLFLVLRGPGPFFTPQFPEEYTLSLDPWLLEVVVKFLVDLEKAIFHEYFNFLSKIKRSINDNLLGIIK